MADTPTREPTELEKRLHTALREHGAIYRPFTRTAEWQCALCEQMWSFREPERHAPGCLARPDALGDEHE